MMKDAIERWLRNRYDRLGSGPRVVSDEETPIEIYARRIGKILTRTFSSSISDDSIKQDLAIQFLVLAHHPDVSQDGQISWIGLVQKLGMDPALIAVEGKDMITKAIWRTLALPIQDSSFGQAAFRALTTLDFLCPTIYVDLTMDRIRADLSISSLKFIGLDERGIWATPPDQLFVDVLSTKKDGSENKNRKDYATDKWEQEIRETVAKKRASTTGANLSKADKALVSAQLAKEAETRKAIVATQGRLQEGVELIASLVASNTEAMRRCVGEMAALLLGTVFGPGSFFMDYRAFEVLLVSLVGRSCTLNSAHDRQQIGSMASDRLGEYRRLLPAAILRADRAPLIPDDYLHEDLAG